VTRKKTKSSLFRPNGQLENTCVCWWHSGDNLTAVPTYFPCNFKLTKSRLKTWQWSRMHCANSKPQTVIISPHYYTTGPNNNVKLFLPNVSWRIFLFLLFPSLFPYFISIFGQYRYSPEKVLITANKLRNPFLSSFLANTNILQNKKSFKCFYDSWDSFAAANYGHSTFCKKKRRVENTQSSQ